MEHSFIAWLKQRCFELPQPRVGIGDDAAILDPPQLGHVVTTDTLCEGTHFHVDQCGPQAVGRKLMAVNLSDLASMASDPVAVFATLCLPRTGAAGLTSGALGAEITEGIRLMCEEYGVSLAGGDTNVWDGPLVVSLTAIGSEPEQGCWLRSGGNVGDKVFVTGDLGGSILGSHLSFTPRVQLAKQLRQQFAITAATDISDGLGIDLLNVFTASGCGALLNRESVPISDGARQLSETSGKSPLEHAMGDGEDFELLFTVTPDVASTLPSHLDGVQLTEIGELINRTGLWCLKNGKYTQITPLGYIHK